MEILFSGLEVSNDEEGVREIFPIGLPALGRFFEPGSRKPTIERASGRYFQ